MQTTVQVDIEGYWTVQATQATIPSSSFSPPAINRKNNLFTLDFVHEANTGYACPSDKQCRMINNE
jgi:hypothetical protein